MGKGCVMRRVNVTISEADYVATKGFSERMVLSRILRCLLTALRTSDVEWEVLLKEDAKLRETREWIRDHIVGRFLKS